MIHPTDPNPMIGGCSKHPGQPFLNCYFCMLDENVHKSEPSKKTKKKPTGILKDLSELKRYSTGFENVGSVLNENGAWIKRSDVEAIINKYMNP